MEFRFAERKDSALVFEFIKGIADYEKMSDEVIATAEIIEDSLFNKNQAEIIFVMENGVEVGFALFFSNFSTFIGKSGLYLEDLFVKPEHRGKGYGKALFSEVARIANERGCKRMEWCCLDWNKPSIDFYLSLGARPMSEWTTYRLAGEELRKFG